MQHRPYVFGIRGDALQSELWNDMDPLYTVTAQRRESFPPECRAANSV